MKRFLLIILFLILLYTRFIGLDWGLPYPMHPDERNMAVAVQSLNCEFSIFPSVSLRAGNFQFSTLQDCLNPQFYAYGQFPLFVAYLFIQFWHAVVGRLGDSIRFTEAVLSLRLIAALASVFNVLILLKILDMVTGSKLEKWKNYILYIAFYLILVFSPYAIQFAHFGTTESLLMLFYSLIVYMGLYVLAKNLTNTYIILLALTSGIAIATKASSFLFLVVPLLIIIYKSFWQSVDEASKEIRHAGGLVGHKFLIFFKLATAYLMPTAIFSVVFSPHNIINWSDFISSMQYETNVGTGAVRVFYTRIFEQSIPFVYQMAKIFPYAMGWPAYILFVSGFLFLSWKDARINLLRFTFILYFIPTALLYAKWTRFMAPIFPIMLLFAALTTLNIANYLSGVNKISYRIRNTIYLILITVIIIPGIAYLSIYQNPDVRMTASEWIYKNIPDNSYILSETANVVDIPLPGAEHRIADNKYRVISFDFYNLDNNAQLQFALQQHIQNADYIFVPSRRVFANHTCIKPETWNLKQGFHQIQLDYYAERCKKLELAYPSVNDYYARLFSGGLGFTQVAEISSYPRINFQFPTFNFQFEFPDEDSEETWTVFDHPVIRVFKRINHKT